MDRFGYFVATVGSYFSSRRNQRGDLRSGYIDAEDTDMRGGGSNLELVKDAKPRIPYDPPEDFREAITRIGSVLLIGLIIGGGCTLVQLIFEGVFGQ